MCTVVHVKCKEFIKLNIRKFINYLMHCSQVSITTTNRSAAGLLLSVIEPNLI